ncbi:hypothetical protein D041_0583A, partial [Vibrio parahaemolyticus EKP-008]
MAMIEPKKSNTNASSTIKAP